MEQGRIRDMLRGCVGGTVDVDVLFAVEGHDIVAFDIAGRDPLPLWHTLRGRTRETGLYPLFVCGYSDVRDRQRDEDAIDERVVVLGQRAREGERSVAGVIRAALAIDTDAWLREAMARLVTDLGITPNTLRGDWPPDAVPYHHFAILDARRFPAYPLYLALIPTRLSWQTLAFLMYGGWHSELDPEHHVALAKRWHKRYGAELVAVMPDTVEMRVMRPPRTHASALRLAWEHYTYCIDVVIQGTQTIDALAAGLLNGRSWFFWWD